MCTVLVCVCQPDAEESHLGEGDLILEMPASDRSVVGMCMLFPVLLLAMGRPSSLLGEADGPRRQLNMCLLLNH